MDDRALRRAGLDYHEYAHVAQHESYPDFLTTVQPTCVYAFSTRAVDAATLKRPTRPATHCCSGLRRGDYRKRC